MHFHTQSDVHITLHGSRRATQRVCVRASFHLHVIHDVCLSVRCLSLCVCPSPVSLRRLPLLFHSTCTLTSTSSQMSTASRELTTAPSHNDFELLDARISSALNKIIQNTRFKKKVSLEEMKAHKEDTSSEEDFGSLGPTILSRSMRTYLQLFFDMMIFRNSIKNGTKFCCR